MNKIDFELKNKDVLVNKIAETLMNKTEEELAEKIFDGTLEDIFSCNDCPAKKFCDKMLNMDQDEDDEDYEPSGYTCKDVLMIWMQDSTKFLSWVKTYIDVTDSPKFKLGDIVTYKNGHKKFIIVGARFNESNIRLKSGYYTYEIKNPDVGGPKYWMYEEKLELYKEEEDDVET